jgi:hypothetical protein
MGVSGSTDGSGPGDRLWSLSVTDPGADEPPRRPGGAKPPGSELLGPLPEPPGWLFVPPPGGLGGWPVGGGVGLGWGGFVPPGGQLTTQSEGRAGRVGVGIGSEAEGSVGSGRCGVGIPTRGAESALTPLTPKPEADAIVTTPAAESAARLAAASSRGAEPVRRCGRGRRMKAIIPAGPPPLLSKKLSQVGDHDRQ